MLASQAVAIIQMVRDCTTVKCTSEILTTLAAIVHVICLAIRGMIVVTMLKQLAVFVSLITL